ncbi:MAG: Xaa-Pro peptidase family protein [Mariprofundales bacterium]|nr:Xaa-Pro peptidase family protein [Mariprofundales bacterium]
MNRLMISDSEHDADMLYISGVFVPDAWIVVQVNGAWYGLCSPLEVDRIRKTSRLDHVLLDSAWRQQAKARFGEMPGLAPVAAAFLLDQGVDAVEVPTQCGYGVVCQLQACGVTVSPCAEAFFPQRAIKRDDELRELAHAERLTAKSMAQAVKFLAECSIGDDGCLRHPDHGRSKLRAADLRAVIEQWLIGHGAVPSHTIVACGREGADPHNEGSGLLRAHQPIIIDIFPRLTRSGYWGDMTRTLVKGDASAQVKAMHRAVAAAQLAGIAQLRDGVEASVVHAVVAETLKSHGFTTGVHRGRQQGFFHGTGHGVGLEVHESPRVSTRGDRLQAGHVVTVEPGLYYPGVGGVRIEDLLVVTEHGCDNLTRFHRRLEIV